MADILRERLAEEERMPLYTDFLEVALVQTIFIQAELVKVAGANELVVG